MNTELNVTAHNFLTSLTIEDKATTLARDLATELHRLELQYDEEFMQSVNSPDILIEREGVQRSMHQEILEAARRALQQKDSRLINLQTGEFTGYFRDSWHRSYNGSKSGILVMRVISRAEKTLMAERAAQVATQPAAETDPEILALEISSQDMQWLVDMWAEIDRGQFEGLTQEDIEYQRNSPHYKREKRAWFGEKAAILKEQT